MPFQGLVEMNQRILLRAEQRKPFINELVLLNKQWKCYSVQRKQVQSNVNNCKTKESEQWDGRKRRKKLQVKYFYYKNILETTFEIKLRLWEYCLCTGISEIGFHFYFNPRSSCLEVFCKKMFLEISQISQESTCARVSFLRKFQTFVRLLVLTWSLYYFL